MVVPASRVGRDGQGVAFVVRVTVRDLQGGSWVPGNGHDHPTRSSMVDRRVFSFFRAHSHVGEATVEVLR